MLWKVLSDGAINEVGADYAGIESRAERQSGRHFYHQLERRYSEEDEFDNNPPASYVDLIN